MKKEKNKEIKKTNIKKSVLILRILIIVFLIIASLSTIDIILVNNYKVGPYFVVKTKSKKGTKTYYGFGYKIIKYEQINGKYDTKIGAWSMKYNDKPEQIEISDLAINYVNNVKATYKTYYGKFIKMEEKIELVDKTNNIIRLKYSDPDGKYNLAVDYYLYDQDKDLSNYKQGDIITIVGTINGYRNKSNKEDIYTLTVKNAFILK